MTRAGGIQDIELEGVGLDCVMCTCKEQMGGWVTVGDVAQLECEGAAVRMCRAIRSFRLFVSSTGR